MAYHIRQLLKYNYFKRLKLFTGDNVEQKYGLAEKLYPIQTYLLLSLIKAWMPLILISYDALYLYE